MRLGTLAALGIAVALAVTGCRDSVAGMPAPVPGSAAASGSDTGESKQDKGFDECGLVEADEVAEILGVAEMYVTVRSARVLTDGSRRASCTYFPEDLPGQLGMILNTVTDTDPERFFAPFKEFDNVLPVDIGERGEAVGYTARGTSNHFYEFRTIDGNRGIHLLYSFRDGGGVMPGLDDGGKSLGELLTTALARLPGELVIPDGKPEGACADIDLESAADVLGAELLTARSVEADSGAFDCEFSNGPASLSVTVATDEVRTKAMAVPAGEITDRDIGEGARVRMLERNGGKRALVATVNLGDRVLLLNASYDDSVGALAKPRPEDIELVRAIVSAIADTN